MPTSFIIYENERSPYKVAVITEFGQYQYDQRRAETAKILAISDCIQKYPPVVAPTVVQEAPRAKPNRGLWFTSGLGIGAIITIVAGGLR